MENKISVYSTLKIFFIPILIILFTLKTKYPGEVYIIDWFDFVADWSIIVYLFYKLRQNIINTFSIDSILEDNTITEVFTKFKGQKDKSSI